MLLLIPRGGAELKALGERFDARQKGRCEVDEAWWFEGVRSLLVVDVAYYWLSLIVLFRK